jgi:cytochrome c
MIRWASLAISIAVVAGATPLEAQDAKKGEAVFRPCRACHALDAGAKKKPAPPLKGVVGRKAAAVAGYTYSDAMQEAARKGLTWTEANLAAYLESPDTFLPQGVMAFSGVKNEGELKDLIAFLKTQK